MKLLKTVLSVISLVLLLFITSCEQENISISDTTGCGSGTEASADSGYETEFTVEETTEFHYETIPGIEQNIETEKAMTEQVTEVGTTEPETGEPQIKDLRISFRGFGDNLIYRSTYVQAYKDDGTYDFKPKYEGVRDLIQSADIAYINQETPMCGEKYGYSSYPTFNTPNELGVNLVELGFDVIGFANNHMTDMAKKGSTSVAEMIDFTDTLDALIIGLYRDKEDFDNIRIYEYEDVKIAFLAYTYGTNWFAAQSEPERVTGAYIPIYDEETVTRQVGIAKEKADVVIVTIHWGKEYSFKPNATQIQYAQLMADLGVDVIIGHHPHVIQKIEWLTGVNGNKTLCYYSLGNGLNAQDMLYCMVGITADFEIVRDENGIYIDNASCTPLFNAMEKGYKNIRLIKLEDLTEDIAIKHHCNSTDQKVTVEKAYNIVIENISKEFLPDYLISE